MEQGCSPLLHIVLIDQVGKDVVTVVSQQRITVEQYRAQRADKYHVQTARV